MDAIVMDESQLMAAPLCSQCWCLVSFLLATAVLASALPAGAAGWKRAAGPLETRWAKDVSPAHALPDYPRMQMVRANWKNLNGLWDYAITDKAADAPATYDGQILVPYPVESSLSGVMKPVDQNHRLWYHLSFQAPEVSPGGHLLLHFGAVDWDATVTLNGKEVGEHKGGYDGFSFDITPDLKTQGPQDLVVSVWDPTDTGTQPHGKQVLHPGGIMYTSTTGIWQTVWLEPVPAAYIDNLKMVPDLDAGAVRITVDEAGADNPGEVTAEALDGRAVAGKAHGQAGQEIVLKVRDPKPWSPDNPFLYDLKVSLKQNDKLVDSVKSYFGLRKIALGKDAEGITRPMLNGKFVFQIGPLDQGFWPDGIYTAPTDEALRSDIETMKKLGFNMARKHVKVEPDRWYYWCDKLGLLVWQDMPAGSNAGDEAHKQFETELDNMIRGRWNHPCIIQWVTFNEGWGEYDAPRIVAHVKELDPSRLVDDASGWTDFKVGDVIDMHNYPGPGSPKPEDNRAAVLGEFGGLGLAIKGHTWSQKSWGYRQEDDRAKLTQSYAGLLRRVWALKDDPGLSAAVYTQLTDCETECNGLMTYDRAMVKEDIATVAAANTNTLPAEPPRVTLMPTAEKTPLTWRYTTDDPGAGWMKPDFNDQAWKEGQAGFGTAGTPNAIVNTTWNSADIWLRRVVTLPDQQIVDPKLRVYHDEDVEVYLNGVLALKEPGFVNEYDDYDIQPAGVKTLKPGTVVIAVRCHQTTGGQGVDVGLNAAQGVAPAAPTP